MMIVILGNMGTGKTTISKMLSEELNIPYLSIDQIRYEVFKRTPRLEQNMDMQEIKAILAIEIKWEKKAKRKLIKRCSNQKDFILETLGISPIYGEIIKNYKKQYPNEKIIAFKLYAPLSELKKRVIKRSVRIGFVPVPQQWKCEWGNCYMKDHECLLFSLKWANKLSSHFDPYIHSKWNSKQNSPKSIVKKIIKYLKM